MLRTSLWIYIIIRALASGNGDSNDTVCTPVPVLSTRPRTIFDPTGFAEVVKLQKVFRYLRIRTNSTVADVGAGAGWLTVILAKYVGSTGKVYAQDVLQTQISYAEEKIKIYQLNNVEVVIGSHTDPKLPENALDAVIIVNAYHEFRYPITMLTQINQAMKLGARLAIIDRDTDDMRIEAREMYAQVGYIQDRANETTSRIILPSSHYLAVDIVVNEAVSVGFKFLFSRELGRDHYVAIFSKQ